MLIDIEKRLIQSKIYPLLKNYDLESVIINEQSNFITNEVNFFINDEKDYIIYKNKTSEKDLKIKLIAITDPSSLSKFNNSKSMMEIESISREYGFQTKDLTVYNLKLLKDEETKQYLLTEKFTHSYNQLKKYFSIGLMFYYDNLIDTDLNSFMTPQNFEITDSDGVFVKPQIIIDKRSIKRVFKTTQFLNTIIENINVDYDYIKRASDKEKKIPQNQYFSNIYISRNKKGFANLLFSFNHKKIVESSVKYKEIFKNHAFEDDITKNFKISSLKVIKRQIQSDKKFFPIRDTNDVVVQSSQSFKTDRIISENNPDGSIKQINLFNKLSSFEIIDKTAFQKRNAYFQYGVELSIIDGSYLYFKEIYENLNFNLSLLNEYKNNLEILNKVSFTLEEGKKIVNSFVNSLIALNNSFAKENIDQLNDSLTALINPSIVKNNSILYFIELFEKLINQVNKLLNNSLGKTIDISYWFTNEILDTNISYDVGYEYINNSYEGFNILNNAIFEDRIKKELEKYIGSTSFDESEKLKLYSFISPEKVKVFNDELNLEDISLLSSFDFAKFELLIKRFNLGDRENTEIEVQEVSKIPSKLTLEEKFVISKIEKTINKFGLNVKNQIKPLNNSELFKTESNKTFSLTDYEVVPTYLYLSILKNEIKNNTFRTVIDKDNFSLKPKKSKKTDFISVPLHIDYLLNKKDKIFTDKTKNYFKDLDENSKFLFLFNCIHKIEVLIETKPLKNGIPMKSENWVPLTEENLSSVGIKFCRLSLYQDPENGINEFKSIDLPIYDRYFILQTSVPAIQTKKTLQESLKTVSLTVKPSAILELPSKTNKIVPFEDIGKINLPRAVSIGKFGNK